MNSQKDEEKNIDFKLLQSIHNFYINENKNEDINDNILIKYLKDSNIIKENNSNKNIELFINELLKQIQNGNTIILPFIDPCYDLIESYINNDDIDDINIEDNSDDNLNKKFQEVFNKLIENSFISRKNLIPIYAYFTELYTDPENINESEAKLNKFSKMVNLWKIFYNNTENKSKPKNLSSSFCFLGSGLEMSPIKNLPKDYFLKVKINLLNQDFLNYINKDDYLISIENEKIKYSQILNNPNDIITSIQFDFNFYKKEKNVEIMSFCNNKILEYIFEDINIDNKKINILNNFYGQIKSIEVSFYKENKKQNEICKKNIFPFPLKSNGGIIFSSQYKVNIKNTSAVYYDPSELANNNNSNEYEIEFELKIKDIKLVKVNYINYKENKFNVMDYFGGITQFLPFLNIINGLSRNKNINKINGVEKEEILIDFVINIFKVIFNNITKYGKDKQKYLEKKWKFFLYVINKIEVFNFEKVNININDFTSWNMDKEETINFYKIFMNFLRYINGKDERNENFLIQSIAKIHSNMGNEKIKNNIYIENTNNQLYRNIIKQLFIYNRLWSKQYLFFGNVFDCYKNNERNIKIKYKRINYCTSNFQQPLIYPILEINKYYPEFKRFTRDNLYKTKDEKVLNYDFSLDNFKNNLSEKIVNTYLDKYNICDKIKCCLVKKMYHIRGEIGILDLNDNNFKIVFLSKKLPNKEKCNKMNNNKEYNSHLCYGSVFSCLEKEKNKIICIPQHIIMFAIIRVYYYRPSGLEIFTTNFKSYYFNFYEEFNLNNKNKIIKYLSINFKEFKHNNTTLGWYNSEYSNALKPLFDDNIDDWKEKKYYYSNFDKLMIINIFSNRSLNDLNQFPIFPMLYDEIGLHRIMDKPIGLQDINQESKERKEFILESYKYDSENEYNEEDNYEKYYFNIFFSNITYTCNYLLRIFPYSFIAIEYQGDGFDSPNRLFFSIKSTFNNTLRQRSDLRELIPEMFYFPQIFYNINELELHKLTNSDEIDEVYIQDKKEGDLQKYIFLKKMRDNLEKEENLNLWIDLIFGKNKEYNEKNERYYNQNSNITFKSNPKILNDSISMQSYDFGVLPYQLFNKEFPKKPIISPNIEKEIYNLNKKQFKEDHIHCLYDEKKSFICLGRKGISDEYMEIINKIKRGNSNIFSSFIGSFGNIVYSNKTYNKDYLSYLFVGDVFGNLSVYVEIKINPPVTKKEKEIEESNAEKNILNRIDNNDFTLMKELNDHISEIKYIDYNSRLNLLIDYSLDGYINLYTVPTLKLIRSIQSKDLGIMEIIKNVVLISNPFPMICLICLNNIFFLDINGRYIKKCDNIKNAKLEFCIDKNCGFFNDYISVNENGKEIIYI